MYSICSLPKLVAPLKFFLKTKYFSQQSTALTCFLPLCVLKQNEKGRKISKPNSKNGLHKISATLSNLWINKIVSNSHGAETGVGNKTVTPKTSSLCVALLCNTFLRNTTNFRGAMTVLISKDDLFISIHA